MYIFKNKNNKEDEIKFICTVQISWKLLFIFYNRYTYISFYYEFNQTLNSIIIRIMSINFID